MSPPILPSPHATMPPVGAPMVGGARGGVVPLWFFPPRRHRPPADPLWFRQSKCQWVTSFTIEGLRWGGGGEEGVPSRWSSARNAGWTERPLFVAARIKYRNRVLCWKRGSHVSVFFVGGVGVANFGVSSFCDVPIKVRGVAEDIACFGRGEGGAFCGSHLRFVFRGSSGRICPW